jgi:hypothetical protein
MAEAARDLGHEYLVLTDHSARLTVAHGLDAERLRKQLEVVAALNEDLAPFRILTDIEVDILEDGTLDQEEELLAQLDVVVASVHSKPPVPVAVPRSRSTRARNDRIHRRTFSVWPSNSDAWWPSTRTRTPPASWSGWVGAVPTPSTPECPTTGW